MHQQDEKHTEHVCTDLFRRHLQKEEDICTDSVRKIREGDYGERREKYSDNQSYEPWSLNFQPLKL